MKSKSAKRSRMSEAKVREIVRYVAADLTDLQAAALSGLNRNTVNRLYRGVRERMLLACEAQRQLFGIVEVDESFFGARRLRRNRRLRHLRAVGLRLCRDRPGLLEAHHPGHHPRPRRTARWRHLSHSVGRRRRVNNVRVLPSVKALSPADVDGLTTSDVSRYAAPL